MVGRSGQTKIVTSRFFLLRELLLSERYEKDFAKTGNEHGKRDNEKNGNKTSVEPKPYQ